jgi:cytochrome b
MRAVMLSRRASAFLVAVGVWTWLIWPTFLKNIWKDDRSFGPGHRPTSFLLVHAVLVLVSLVIGTAIGVLGWRGWRASSRASGHERALRDFVRTRD